MGGERDAAADAALRQLRADVEQAYFEQYYDDVLRPLRPRWAWLDVASPVAAAAVLLEGGVPPEPQHLNLNPLYIGLREIRFSTASVDAARSELGGYLPGHFQLR